MRDFDFVMFEHDVVVGLGDLIQDILSGMIGAQTVVSGFAVTQTAPTSLTINIGPGRIYALGNPDPTAVGSIPQDVTTICGLQGQNPGQAVTFVPPGAGFSQWNLIQVQFSSVDQVRAGDPTGGVVPFYNSTNPTIPNNASIATVRQQKAIIQVIQGTAAVTGSEVPPQPSAGWTPLYLVDIAGGQSAVSASQVIVTGPSVGLNVPTNYPIAPFLAGFQASHHSGKPGQAPKINLQTEVQGILPAGNLPPNILTGTFPTVRTILTTNLTLYVSGSGNDSNNGLTTNAAFATIQAAINKVYAFYDIAGFQVTISVAAGTFAGVTFSGAPTGASAITVPIIISGAGATTVISGTNINAVYANGGAYVQIQNCYLTATGPDVTKQQGNGIQANNGARVNVGSGVTFGACQIASMLATQGTITILANYTVSGGGSIHYWAGNLGRIIANGTSIVITGNPTFTGAFADASFLGLLNHAGCVFSGSATGPRYAVGTNGVIFTSGGGANYFPGTSAGTTDSGGLYT